MVTRTQAFPSKYWKAVDLPEGGLRLKMAKLELDKIGPEQKEKYILFFKGQDKQLVLNLTNWDLIAAYAGADSDQWVGKDVELYPTQTTFGSKAIDCIRSPATSTIGTAASSTGAASTACR